MLISMVKHRGVWVLQAAGPAQRPQQPGKAPEDLQSSMRRSGLLYYADARLVRRAGRTVMSTRIILVAYENIDAMTANWQIGLVWRWTWMYCCR